MRNVTFSADERLIEAARERARREKTTLNEQFRLWLEAYAAREERARVAMQVVSDRVQISTFVLSRSAKGTASRSTTR